ncbi:putative membrane protein YedE/YeeE [Bradyrhizobium sp. S3.14.4]
MIATPFTPMASLLGGALIGLSAVLLMWATGRIAGVSGIAARLFPPYEDREFAGRLAFVAGLVAAPILVRIVSGSLPVQTIAAGTPVLIVAGLLTGLRCGLGQRLHVRPWRLRPVAVVAAVAGRDHLLHVGGHRHCLRDAALGLTTMAILIQFAIGLVFGIGLIVSGMSNPAKVLNFLDVAGIPAGTWDASLAFVMAGAVAVTFIGFSRVLKLARPFFADRFYLPTRKDIDPRIIAGPAIFGIGWGLAGFCPGPALTALGFGSASAFIFVAAMFAGMVLARFIAQLPSSTRFVAPADPLET